jgi:hypothetical protein
VRGRPDRAGGRRLKTGRGIALRHPGSPVTIAVPPLLEVAVPRRQRHAGVRSDAPTPSSSVLPAPSESNSDLLARMSSPAAEPPSLLSIAGGAAPAAAPAAPAAPPAPQTAAKPFLQRTAAEKMKVMADVM